MDIDIKELEAFAAVVDKGSFSKAAEALFLTQPTISAHVASLERKLETKLLVRTTKELHLSDAGRLLYDYAQQILRLRTDAVQAIRHFSQALQGTVEVAASPISGRYLLPRLIQSFRETYPEVHFHVELTDSAQVAQRVAGRQAELGFSDEPVEAPKCSCQTIAEDRLVIVTPNTPPYQAGQGFPTGQLLRETFVLPEEGSGPRLELERFLRELGLPLVDRKVAVEVGSQDAVKQMVSQGLGISVLSRLVCEDYCQFGRLLAFDLGSDQTTRRLCLVRHKNGVLSPAAQAFSHHAANFFSQEKGAAE